MNREQEKKAKYLWRYNASENKISEVSGITKKEAKKLIEKFNRAYKR